MAETHDFDGLVERFRRGQGNLATLRARLATASEAWEALHRALSDVACGAMLDAGGWPRGPGALSVALTAADAHGTVGRLAAAADGPLRLLVDEAAEIDALVKRRGVLANDHDLREAQFRRVDAMAANGGRLDAEVAASASAYMRSLHALDRATAHATAALEAFDEALEAEEAAAVELVAGARLAHAQRAAVTLAPVVDLSHGDPTASFSRLLDRCRTDDPALRLPESRALADAVAAARADAGVRVAATPSVLGHFESVEIDAAPDTRSVAFLKRRWSGDGEPRSPEERRSETVERKFLAFAFPDGDGPASRDARAALSRSRARRPSTRPATAARARGVARDAGAHTPLPDDLLERMGARPDRRRRLHERGGGRLRRARRRAAAAGRGGRLRRARRRAAAAGRADARGGGRAVSGADDDATASSAWESASGESWASGRDVDLYTM
ncbi:hypothetical protein SO694_00113012 [Aureococcus anophagefferens]|uniref:Uncharacterized protein n=1 Tax=Aureococcus anophagefferens TaxID=44056 RepID=A0ABR1FWY6_AURAN